MTDTPDPAIPEEPPSVDIHKPKPIHSWRELATEIAVIVIGILIALSLEQAVESWHERTQYREARQAMVDELSANLAIIQLRQKFIPCTVQRMQDIGAILDSAEGGKPVEAPGWVGPAVSYRLRFMAEGEAEKTTLFSSAEQRNFGSPYSYFHSLDTEQDRERLAWARLQMLEGKSRLTPEMIQSLRNALADARYENNRIAFLTERAEAWGKQIGVTDMSGAPTNTGPNFQRHPHCVPMNTPAAEAERESAMRPNLEAPIKTLSDFDAH